MIFSPSLKTSMRVNGFQKDIRPQLKFLMISLSAFRRLFRHRTLSSFETLSLSQNSNSITRTLSTVMLFKIPKDSYGRSSSLLVYYRQTLMMDTHFNFGFWLTTENHMSRWSSITYKLPMLFLYFYSYITQQVPFCMAI